MSVKNPKPILPPTLKHWFTLGFTGHRELAQPELVKQKLREYLAKLKEEHGDIATVSSAASGADTLFLEVAEELGLPSAIILPFSREKFSEDFSTDGWQRAQHQIERAIEWRVVEPCEKKAESFLEATVQTVERCDLLLAVLDPKRAHGEGGTADAVNYARVHEKPLVILNPITGELQLPDKLPEPHPGPKVETAPKNQVSDSLKYFDEKAEKNAPAARWIAVWVIALHLLATAFAIIAIALPLPYLIVKLIGVFKVAALVVAWVLVWKHHRHQHEWLEARPAAELCRYFLGIWKLRRRPFSIRWTEGEGYNPLIRDLTIAWQLDKSATLELEAAKKAYLEDRIEDQLKHYTEKQQNLALLVKLTRFSTEPLTLAAIACGLVALVFTDPEWLNKTTKLFSMLLPLLVAAMLSVGTSLDSPRRHKRYGLMAKKLESAKATITAAQTWPSLWRAVDNIEYELLNEVEEWHSLSRFGSSH